MKPGLLIAAGIALAPFLLAPPLRAQAPIEGAASVQLGTTTLWLGSGTATLDLPDVKFLKFGPNVGAGVVTDRISTSKDLDSRIGFNLNGGISVPVSAAQTLSLNGFWARIEDNDSARCTATAANQCYFNALITNPQNPLAVTPGAGGTHFTRTGRDVNQAGLALESKWFLTSSSPNSGNAPAPNYFALGADWRAIFQDLKLTGGTIGNNVFVLNYDEDLDTNYFGAFAAFGGGYTPFLFKGLWERLGLKSSFRVQGGVYYAHSGYSGSQRAVPPPVLPPTLDSDASDSKDDVAFIAAVTLETSKQIGKRTTLSLISDYEYYSYVPDMRYNDVLAGGMTGPNNGTSIDSADAFAMRTSLRLTVKLGPEQLFQDPPR